MNYGNRVQLAGIALAGIALAVAALLTAAWAQQGPAPAKAMPDPEVIDAEGYAQLIAKHRGKPVMVNFWATWCPPCRKELPMIDEVAKKYAAQGVVFLGVSVDDDGELSMVRRFLGRVNPSFPNYRKKMGNTEAFHRSIDPNWRGSIPATFFYGRDGKVTHRILREANREELERYIQELLAAPPAR